MTMIYAGMFSGLKTELDYSEKMPTHQINFYRFILPKQLLVKGREG